MARTVRLKALINSFTGRMVLGVMAVHFLLLPLLFGGIVLFVKHRYEDQFINTVRADAFQFANLIAQNKIVEHLKILIDDALLSGNAIFIEVLDATGKRLAAGHTDRSLPLFAEDFFFGQHEDNVYFIAVPLMDNTGQLRQTVRLGYDETPTREAISAVYRRGVTFAAAYVAATLVIVALLAVAVTRPLRELRETSRNIAHGRVQEQLNVSSRLVELQDLAEDLNFMRSELVKQAEALEYQALHDPLTGLPNRTLLQDRLKQAMLIAEREQRPAALLLLDLDHFKEINDTLGHGVGDLVLQSVANRLREVARLSDTVARLGGDEFAATMIIASTPDISDIAQKLSAALEPPIVVEGRALHVSASIGIAMFPEHGTTFGELLRKADIAMYKAKRQRSGYAIYHASLDDLDSSKLVLTGELHEAMENDQFQVYYQPIVDLRTEDVVAVEALARWRHPNRGLTLPNDFVPLCEDAGLIHALTDRIFKIALGQWRAWHDNGIDINVAVNLSARCLQDDHLLKKITALMTNHEMPGAALEIELTESAIMADPQRARSVFTGLHALGARLSIDDFGTGYSSLTQIKKLPVSRIKIDRSFVSAVEEDGNDVAIIQAVVALARSMNLTTVAEGVTKPGTLRQLLKLDCDFAQGFHIGMPMAAADFTVWLRRRAAKRRLKGQLATGE